MLDFDYSHCRSARSVAAIIYGHHIHKFYWGTKETREAGVAKRPDIDIVVNSVSSRSVYSSTLESLTYPQIKVIALIARVFPSGTREKSKETGVLIIGPATISGIKPGYFRIDSFRGMIDHITSSKLYPPDSIGHVSKPGGTSNELNNVTTYCHSPVVPTRAFPLVVTVNRDQLYIDHLLRYEQDSDCKIFVLFGEIGAIEEYRVIDNVKGIIKKLIVTCAIGTCAKMFITEVQFGHAARMANTDAKNRAMRGFEELAHLSSISWLVDLCPCCLKGDERQDKSKFP